MAALERREELLEQSADAFAACLRGAEGQEGVTAFLEKRDPEFPDRVSGGLPDFFPDYAEPEYY